MHNKGSQAAPAYEAMCEVDSESRADVQEVSENTGKQLPTVETHRKRRGNGIGGVLFLSPEIPALPLFCSSQQHPELSSLLRSAQPNSIHCVATRQQCNGLRRGDLAGFCWVGSVQKNSIRLKIPFLLQNLASLWYQLQI